MATTLTILLLLPSLFYLLKFALSFQASNLSVLKKSSNASGLLNLVGIGSLITLYATSGSHANELLTWEGLGFSLRIDSISLIMYSMVSLIIYFVYRFSINYMAGDEKFRKFAGMFSLISGAVQLLVISGNLFAFFLLWVLTSIGLQQLLKLYPEREKAVRASQTKFVLARLADITLFTSFSIVYNITGTGDLQTLLFDETTLLTLQSSNLMPLIPVLLAITAILKSVQFPFHTWIFGVLECPTPVSALLHAGLLNAGPFLIIRFSNLFIGMELASTVLLVVGAISAIFGTTVYITQSSIKTGLVFSSIGHMGFSLMLCGMGLYAAGLLHLVSHSFYKAYLFLRSGSVIEDVKSTNPKLYKRTGTFHKILASFILAISFYAGISLFTVQFFEIPKALLYVGLIIVSGVFGMLVYSIDSKNLVRTTFKTICASILVLAMFYFMEFSTNSFVAGDIPHHEALGTLRSYISPIIIAFFFLATLLQVLVMVPNKQNLAIALRVHLRNGLYIDSLYRRMGRMRK